MQNCDNAYVTLTPFARSFEYNFSILDSDHASSSAYWISFPHWPSFPLTYIVSTDNIYLWYKGSAGSRGGGEGGWGGGGGISQSQSQSQNFIQYRFLTKNHDWRHTWQIQTCNYHYKTKFILKIAKHPIFPFLTGCIDTFILFRCCASAVKRKPNVLWSKSILHACMTKFGFDDNGSLHFDTLNIYGVRKC